MMTFIQDPYPLYEAHARQRAGPPVGDSEFHGVCAWDAVNDVIARPEDFSSNLTATMTYQDGNVDAFVMGELGGDIQALATADDPVHAAHRKLLVPQLTARQDQRPGVLHRRHRRPTLERRRAGRRHRVDVGDGQSAADDDRHPPDRGSRRRHRPVGAMGLREHPSGRRPCGRGSTRHSRRCSDRNSPATSANTSSGRPPIRRTTS